MVEGGGSKDFRYIKKMMLDEPVLLTELIDLLTVTVRRYCEAQIASGAQAIQIFDTRGGILDPDHYRKFSLDPMFEIVSTMQRGDAPVIVFSRGAGHALKDIAAIGADVVGLDWTVDIAGARSLIGETAALQGNLDPSFLYASPENIRKEVRSILRRFGPGPGHIFNLGHGILPGVPVDHAIAMVRSVHEESPAFHR
jgi:uroporphyrinogen decarboxylase